MRANETLAKFVILDPSDVPLIPNEPNTIIVSRLNDTVRMLNFLVEKQETSCPIPPVPVQWPSAPPIMPTTVPVVLTNLPEELKSRNPVKQREFIQKINCAEKVKHVELKRDRLILHMSNEATALSVPAVIPPGLNIRSKVIKNEHLGIIRIDKDFDASNISGLVTSVTNNRCFGQSSVAQLTFSSMEDLEHALRFGIKIEYCLFHVWKPLTRPKQCFKCQSFGYMARDCANKSKCSRCGESGHSSTYESPCTATTV
jgi:hypothetical protein